MIEAQNVIAYSNDSYLKLLFCFIISIPISVIVLSLLLFFYCYVGIQVRCEDYATDYHWEPYQIRSNMVEGYSWIRLDNNGYNNQFKVKKEKIDYLLMGSSHTEAFNVAGKESVAYLLNKFLEEDYTYNISMSGHYFLTCIKNLKNAYKKYKPSKAIIIETFNVCFSEKDMQNVLENKYPNIKLHTDYKFVYYLQKYLPAIRNLFLQIKSWYTISKHSFYSNYDIKGETQENVEILKEFITFLRGSVPNEIKIIVFYHPSTLIDLKGNFVKPDDKRISNFHDICVENNIIFIDTTFDFIELYKASHILGHGFVNTKVGDGHLNKYGHLVIAKRLIKVIENLNKEIK